MASVTFRGIVKRFGGLEVIRDLDIAVDDGEFVVFVGPSGCGKSTLLRMLSGLETTSAGEILIGDHPVTSLPPKDRDVAMVFQNYALYPHMTAAENIGFPLRIQGMPRAERARRAREAADLLGLSDYLERYPRELSGGQRQRVAMGRAIVRHPQVFLFDEPLSNLDAALRVEMRKEIKLLHSRLGATMIYVTHDQIEALTMADRIVVLRDGRVEQIATPAEIYRRPANTFVASFIGSPPINLMDCVAQGGAALPAGAPAGVALPLAGRPAADGEAVTLGMRPENVVLGPADGADHPGKVIYTETAGQDTALIVDLGWASLTVTVRGAPPLALGDAAGLSLPPDRLHVFDTEGRRREPA